MHCTVFAAVINEGLLILHRPLYAKGNVLAACFSQTSPKGMMHLARQKLQDDVDSPTVRDTIWCQVSHEATEESVYTHCTSAKCL